MNSCSCFLHSLADLGKCGVRGLHVMPFEFRGSRAKGSPRFSYALK